MSNNASPNQFGGSATARLEFLNLTDSLSQIRFITLVLMYYKSPSLDTIIGFVDYALENLLI